VCVCVCVFVRDFAENENDSNSFINLCKNVDVGSYVLVLHSFAGF